MCNLFGASVPLRRYVVVNARTVGNDQGLNANTFVASYTFLQRFSNHQFAFPHLAFGDESPIAPYFIDSTIPIHALCDGI